MTLTSKSLAAWSLCALLSLASTATASSLVVDRGLPKINLNDAAGSDRSNVVWGYPNSVDIGGGQMGHYFIGDSFKLANGAWRVDTIRTWLVSGSKVPGDIYKSITLYLGAAGAGVTAGPTGDFDSESGTDNPNITLTKVSYPGVTDPDADAGKYQSTNGKFYQIYQVDFTNLNYVVSGGTEIQFGLYGAAAAGFEDYYWFNHASNAALSGTPQDGSDGQFLFFDMDNLAAGGDPQDTNSPGWWDKSTDINVQVFATAVPEPSALISAGVGTLILGGVGAIRRRNRRAAA